MKNKKLFIVAVLAVILLLAVESYIYFNFSKFQKPPIHISFILTGDNLDNWDSMMAGAEDAAEDENCVVDFINCPVEYGVSGEIDSLNGALADGADIILISSIDYNAMKAYVDENDLGDKVFYVKNGIYGDSKNSVMTDDYELGIEFAKYITDNVNAKRLVLVTQTEDVNTLSQVNGIMETLTGMGIEVDYRKLSKNETKLNQSMYNLGQSGLYNGYITLDLATLTAACEAKSKLNKDLSIFSISSNIEAVYYMDAGIVNGLLFKDDYSMGYLAVKKALKSDLITADGFDTKLYYILDKNMIHTEEMEKILFPFVK